MKYLIRYRLILYVTLLVVVFADCSDSFAEDIVSVEIYEKKQFARMPLLLIRADALLFPQKTGLSASGICMKAD